LHDCEAADLRNQHRHSAHIHDQWRIIIIKVYVRRFTFENELTALEIKRCIMIDIKAAVARSGREQNELQGWDKPARRAHY
jgi:hypothetical protein